MANAATSVLLLVLLVLRKNYREYPAFTLYVLVNMASGGAQFLFYRSWGYSSRASWLFGWETQLAVICARASAVAEICQHILSRYRGIWALAKRIFAGCAVFVLLYAGVAARRQWELALPSADRALELAVASVIVLLLLFARYYEVSIERTDRLLGIGLCLYSCFRVLNDTILERFLYQYTTLWSILGSVAFFVTLCVWSWAARKQRVRVDAENTQIPQGAYESMAPEINRRLRELNDVLSKIWKA